MVTTTTTMNSFTPLGDNIFVTEMDEGDRLTSGGIILTSDNMSDRGIRPRWAKIWSMGPKVTDLEVGEWVLIEHGRWTLRLNLDIAGDKVSMWKIDPAAILLVSNDRDNPSANQRFYHK